VPGHAGHARHGVREPCDHGIRSDPGRGRAFRRRVTGRIDAFAPNAKVVHIDIDPTSISKNIRVDVPIVGDAKNVLRALLGAIRKAPDTKAWLDQIDKWRRISRSPIKKTTSSGLNTSSEKIQELTKGDAIIATEVGQNQMWSCLFYKHHQPRPGSRPAAWARWVSACRRPSARSWGGRKGGLRHRRRRLDPDEHPGTGDRRAQQTAGEDRHTQQRLSGHGAPMAGAVL